MFTKAQQMMLEDGCPPALFLTVEQRQAAWVANPPKQYFYDDQNDPEVIQRKQMREALEQEAVRVRNLRFAALKAKKGSTKIDTRGMRWNSRSNKWEPEPNSQDRNTMAKWIITPYDAEGAPVQRGITSVADDAGEVQVFAKMGAAYHRCAAGSVKKITVTNEAGELLREWEEGGAVLPKPVPESKADDKTIKQAKAKGTKKAEKAAKANGAGKVKAKVAAPKEGKAPGVIATIVATISRAQGASVDECLSVLTKTFPQREPKGMLSTVRIQANRNATTKDKDDKRGVVYYRK